MNLIGQCDMIETSHTCSVIQMTSTHADRSSCFSCSLRRERRQLVGDSPTAQAQVHLRRLLNTSTGFEASLVIELITVCIHWKYYLKCQAFFCAASSQTKDCLQLLKLLGVPVIQVRPAEPRIYIFLSPSLSFLPSLRAFSVLSPSLSLCVVLQAPGDAEALCARLVREGTVDAVASEDMDTLPFGANILIRQLNANKDR